MPLAMGPHLLIRRHGAMAPLSTDASQSAELQPIEQHGCHLDPWSIFSKASTPLRPSAPPAHAL